MAVASILFALGDTPDKYWSHIFTGLIIGHMGMGGVYVGCTTMIMSGARKGEEGVVGAVTYTAYQMGATLGLAGELPLRLSSSFMAAMLSGDFHF